MAVIPESTKGLRHVRKTITFTGGAGSGAAGSVTVFTITGRVLVERFTVYCTTDLTDTGGATLDFGVTGFTSLFTNVNPIDPATALDAGEWWDFSGPAAARVGGGAYTQYDAFYISADPIFTVALADINGGVVVVDMWYTPITDDGALAGDDITTAGANVGAWLGTAVATPAVAGVPEVDVTHWLGTAAATPTVAGVPEVDITHIGGTAVTAAAGIPEVKVASIANGAVTAAAVATDAIDADALAADALTEIFNKVLTTALTEAYAADGAAPTLAQFMFMLWSALAEFSISTTTITAKKLDGSTTAMTFTLDSATNPTSRTRAT